MVIIQEVYKLLVDCPSVPPEIGGILGTRNGVVCDCYFDDGCAQTDKAVYTPDAKKLNAQIARWETQGIHFAGMFHSHPLDQPTLSAADKEYICAIFRAMPTDVTRLFFPVVIPGERVLAYEGVRTGETVCIHKNHITIIRKEKDL